jgi:hypothetical protein
VSSRRYAGEGEGHTDAGHDIPLAEPPAHCRHNGPHLIHTLGILLDERCVAVEEFAFHQLLDSVTVEVVGYILCRSNTVICQLTIGFGWRPATAIITKSSIQHQIINMSPIDDALASLESLKPGESINYTQVANKYGCDRSTLSRRHRGYRARWPRRSKIHSF